MVRTFLLAIATALLLAIAVALMAGCAGGRYVGEGVTNETRRDACEPSTWALHVPGYVHYFNVRCVVNTRDQAAVLPPADRTQVKAEASGR